MDRPQKYDPALGWQGNLENALWENQYRKNEITNEAGERKAEAQTISEGMSIAFVTLSESGAIDDVTAAEHATLFAEWQIGIDYKQGNIRHYGDKLYKCLQAHTSQEGWEPDTAVSLWKVIGDPTVEYPEWSQPVGAGDAYMTGDKVSHAGKHWLSTVDNNVWEPGVYGWDEVVTT